MLSRKPETRGRRNVRTQLSSTSHKSITSVCLSTCVRVRASFDDRHICCPFLLLSNKTEDSDPLLDHLVRERGRKYQERKRRKEDQGEKWWVADEMKQRNRCDRCEWVLKSPSSCGVKTFPDNQWRWNANQVQVSVSEFDWYVQPQVCSTHQYMTRTWPREREMSLV